MVDLDKQPSDSTGVTLTPVRVAPYIGLMQHLLHLRYFSSLAALVALLSAAACDTGSGLPEVPLDEAWALDYEPAGAPETLPLVVGDTLIVATAGLDLVCLRIETGQVKWRTRATDDFTIQSLSLVTDGQYLFTSHTTERHHVYLAYDLANGQLAWQQEADEVNITQISRRGYYGAGDGAFYAGDYLAGYVYAFDSATGALRWRIHGDSVRTSAAFYDGNAVYLAQIGSIGRLTKVDASTGAVLWTVRDATGGLGALPFLDGNAVVMTGSTLKRFDAATGELLFSAPGHGDANTPTRDGEWLYGSAESPWKYSHRTGETAWVSDYRPNGTNDAILGDRVYHAGGGLAILDAETGRLLHEEPSPAGYTEFVVAAAGLVITQSTGRITAYRPGRIPEPRP